MNLNVYRIHERCGVLGPGNRAVIWVQGCPFRCSGCVAPETLPFDAGDTISVPDLADRLTKLGSVEGVTFTGGEPMAQAEALVELVDAIRPRREWTYVAYTGYVYEDLVLLGTPAKRALLARLDMLVNGAYVPSRHTDLRWRGSDNQRVLFLTERYRHLAPMAQDRGTWIEVVHSDDGCLEWMGIPPRGFRAAFERILEGLGVPQEPLAVGAGPTGGAIADGERSQ